MLRQSGWQMTTFCHKIYIFGFPLLEAILKVKSTYKDHKTAANQQPDTHTPICLTSYAKEYKVNTR